MFSVFFVSCSWNKNGSMGTLALSEEQYLTDMIAHHEESIDSSGKILAHTENSRINTLAENIMIHQKDEQDELENLKRVWYPNSDAVIGYSNMMPDITQYSNVSDKEKAYLEGMIRHNQIAITMSEQVLLTDARHNETSDIAYNVIRKQNEEIDELQEILNTIE